MVKVTKPPPLRQSRRYGHRVSFLRPDRQPAAKAITVLESHAGYQSLKEQLERLHRLHPQAHFHLRIDAAGQYAANLEHFLRGLPLPMTVSIGEPKRNKDYQKAHFPKRTTDDTESQTMARFAIVEEPAATPPPVPQMVLLRDVVSRLQAQVKQTTQTTNRLHKRHPREMGTAEINAFLTHLAVEGHVAASTQNQAFAALCSSISKCWKSILAESRA